MQPRLTEQTHSPRTDSYPRLIINLLCSALMQASTVECVTTSSAFGAGAVVQLDAAQHPSVRPGESVAHPESGAADAAQQPGGAAPALAQGAPRHGTAGKHSPSTAHARENGGHSLHTHTQDCA